ncbi:hypothetical protein DMA11_08740 [Marinilabiliaceae bacterium JC017]|nr:hypothetical protein DMA11_08740 [Marinilabiliaceae bacterium JC017]
MKTLILIGALTAIILLIITWYGGFKTIKIRTENVGGEYFVYESLQGDYRQSASAMDRIYQALLKEEITTIKGAGVYYDNPQKVEKANLHCEAGCLLEAADKNKIEQLKDHYLIKQLERKEYLVTSFPYKNKLSVFFSLMKVYPALQKYCKTKGYTEDTPVTEIYDIPSKQILYRKEIL